MPGEWIAREKANEAVFRVGDVFGDDVENGVHAGDERLAFKVNGGIIKDPLTVVFVGPYYVYLVAVHFSLSSIVVPVLSGVGHILAVHPLGIEPRPTVPETE